jgi:hypothetical protein
MKRETFGMKLARTFRYGILAIMLMSVIVPLAAYAGQNGTQGIGVFELTLLGLVAFGFVSTKEFKVNGKTVKLGLLGIDKGFYKEADAKRGAIVMLEEMYAKDADEESPYLGLSHAEIYRKKKELKAAGLEVPLTAFEKQLILAGVKINGAYADQVEKFFATTASTVLFPAYVSDQILVGQLMEAPVNDFIHTRTTINAKSYDKVTMSETEEQRQTKQRSEGSDLREFTIVIGDKTVSVKTYGGLLKASYKAVRFAKLPVFAKFIQRIGLQINIDKMDELVLVLKNGDGTTGTAITAGRTYTQAASGAIALADIIGWSNFANMPYKIDKFVGLKAHINEWATALASMNNASAQLSFAGVQVPRSYEWPRSASGLDASTNAFYGIDSRFAIEEINNGPILVESDKLIDKQLERTAITEDTGYVLDPNAVFRFTAI